MSGARKTGEIDTKPASAVIPFRDARLLWSADEPPALGLQKQLRELRLQIVERGSVPWPVQRMSALTRCTGPREVPALKGRKLVVVQRDPGVADALAETLRARGAQVVVLGVQEPRLSRVEALEPELVIVYPGELSEPHAQVLRALWDHPWLRWTPVLLVAQGALGSEGESAPDVRDVALQVQLRTRDFEALSQEARAKESFTWPLDKLGPVRTLRALIESGRSLRAGFSTAQGTIEVDVREGLLVGAQLLRDGASVGAEEGGVHALVALFAEEQGTVQVRTAALPANTNVMSPLEAVLLGERDTLQSADMTGPRNRVMVRDTEEAAPCADDDESPTTATFLDRASLIQRRAAAPAELNRASAPPTQAKKTLVGVPAPVLPDGLVASALGSAPTSPPSPPRAFPSRPAPATAPVEALKPPPGLRVESEVPPPRVLAPDASELGGTKAPIEAPPSPSAAAPSEPRAVSAAETLPTFAPDPELDVADFANAVRRPSLASPRVRGWAEAMTRIPQRLGAAGPFLRTAAARFESLSRARRLQLAAAACALLVGAIGLGLASRAEPVAPPLAAVPPPALAVASAAKSARAKPAAPTPTHEPAAQADAPSDGEADAEGQASAEADLKQASALVGQGHAYRKRGRLQAARAAYERALEAYPGYPRALAGLAEVYLASKDGAHALELAKTLVRRRPRFADDHRLLGDAYRSLGKNREAGAAYKRAMRLGSRTARARLKELH